MPEASQNDSLIVSFMLNVSYVAYCLDSTVPLAWKPGGRSSFFGGAGPLSANEAAASGSHSAAARFPRQAVVLWGLPENAEAHLPMSSVAKRALRHARFFPSSGESSGCPGSVSRRFPGFRQAPARSGVGMERDRRDRALPERFPVGSRLRFATPTARSGSHFPTDERGGHPARIPEGCPPSQADRRLPGRDGCPEAAASRHGGRSGRPVRGRGDGREPPLAGP